MISKKLAFHVLTIAYVVMFIAISVQLYGKNGNIEKNIVKIVKEAEITHDFENNLEMDKNNLSENIFSGFFIDNYIIITVAHGINKKNSVYQVFDFEGNEYKAFLKDIDNENDIAYLEINRKFENYSRVKYARGVEAGDKVYSLNYKQERKDGIIEELNNKKISSNIIFEEGDSGGPLLNEKNRIVGINLEIDQNKGKGFSYLLSKFNKN